MLGVATPADAAAWAVEHRDAVRAAVTEHGAVLLRGLGLRDAPAFAAVARGLAGELMVEREAFAPRQPYPGGVYSATPWPANQPMCMHHERSYGLEFPGLMLFACVGEPTSGGATGLADAAAVLEALPPELVLAVRAGRLAAGPQLRRRDRRLARRGVRHRRPRRDRALLPGAGDRVRVATRRGRCGPGSAAVPSSAIR